jgi:hypothetical protein
MFTATRIAAAVTLVAVGSLALVAGPLGPSSDPVLVPGAEAPSPSPSSDPAVRVEGETIVGLSKPGTWDYSGPVPRLQGLELSTYDVMSDSRVSGTGHGIIDADDYGDIGPEWGTFRLENDEGAWEGPMSGFNMGPDTHMTAWLEGEGAYTGLTYYYEIVVSNSGLPLNGPVQGSIYPGAPPPTE